jgi:hypothetical protein
MSLFHRKIDIDINPELENRLQLVTTLRDMYHDIRLTLVIDKQDFIIHEASVEMERTPQDLCHKIKEKVASMTGVQVGPGFTRQVLSRFKGDQGCPNLANLIFITAPLAINAAAVQRQEEEQLSKEEMDSLWHDVLGGVCVAYNKQGESVPDGQ